MALLFLMLCSYNSLAQKKGVKDTLKYLQEKIIAHKDKFQDKDLNFLIKKLRLDIKYYQPMLGRGFKTSYGIKLYFEKNFNLPDEYILPFLALYFDKPVYINRVIGLYSKNFGKWDDEHTLFYGPLIIKDIKGYTPPASTEKAIKDTIYFLADTSKNYLLKIETEGHFYSYVINCKCYPDGTNPVFTYVTERKGTIVTKTDLQKKHRVSLPSLASLALQYRAADFTKDVFYFLEPFNDQYIMHEVFWMKPRKQLSEN